MQLPQCRAGVGGLVDRVGAPVAALVPHNALAKEEEVQAVQVGGEDVVQEGYEEVGVPGDREEGVGHDEVAGVPHDATASPPGP